jgi:oxidase EvaA
VGEPFRDALVRSYRFSDDGESLHTAGEILSWFTEAKTRCDWGARLAPLDAVPGWSRTAEEIGDDAGEQFRIIAVRVEAGTREVTRWTQPLLHPHGEGRAAFVVRVIDGVAHLLVQARPEYGLLDMVEMAPTIQLHPGQDLDDLPDRFVHDALASPHARMHYDNVLSEEGGRFHHALTRYQVIEVGPDVPLDVPTGYCWLTVRQLIDLLRHGHYLNVEARSLLACIHSLC